MINLVEIVQGGEFFNSRNDFFNNIYTACRKGNLKVVKNYINKDNELINKGDCNRMTPLMHASAGGKLEIVEYLLGQKVDINAKDLDGYTSLMHASRNGHIGIVTYLYDKSKETSLESLACASNSGQLRIVDFFLEKKASVDVMDRDNFI